MKPEPPYSLRELVGADDPRPMLALRNRYWCLRWGIYHHHPLCCTLRFALSLYSNQATRRGGKRTERAGMFVPCGIFHHHDLGDEPAPNWCWAEPETRRGFGKQAGRFHKPGGHA